MAFTYFFRDQHTLEALIGSMLPVIAGRSRVRIWDAGCAMGQEPYTLAILLAERMGNFAFRNLRIDATDVDGTGQFQKVVKEATYPADDLARVDREIVARWFERVDGGRMRLVPGITERVSFQRHDLLTLEPAIEGAAAIVCKNVLLHFQPDERVAVMRMFHGALAPGGFLAVEQTQELPKAMSPYFTQVSGDARVFLRREVQA